MSDSRRKGETDSVYLEELYRSADQMEDGRARVFCYLSCVDGVGILVAG
jgi:hypothetical protein